jgi:hypothetical protein
MATPPSIAIEALVLGGPEVVRGVFHSQHQMAEATTKAEAMPAEAMPAEAAIETKNSILEVGNSMLNAIVLAFSPRGKLSSGPSSVPARALSSARTLQAAAKQTIPETPTEVELPTLKPESAAASHLAPPPPHRHSMGPTRPDALENRGRHQPR